MSRRVAITGMGAVTPVGNDVPSTWRALLDGESGIGQLTTFRADTFPVRIAGIVKNFDDGETASDDRYWRRVGRSGRFALAAAREALVDAQLDDFYDPEDRGVALGVTAGRPDLDEVARLAEPLWGGEPAPLVYPSPGDVLERDPNLTVAALASLGGCQGPTAGVSTACTASGHALGEAMRHIQEGDARMMIAGGADSLLTWLDLLGFSLLGALCDDSNDEPTEASRPFDETRTGFVLGEGAVVFVLEEWDSAVARGAHIHAELTGYGSSMNAYRMTDAPPDGGGAITCIQRALDDGGLKPTEIDYVSAHGTSTPGNDASETIAIKEVFGEEEAHRLAISSVKSMTGHLTAAAAALNLLVGVCAMRDGIVPPTTNLRNPDPKLDLNYVPNQAQSRDVRAVLVNSFAFGGTNACLTAARVDGSAA